MPRILPLCVIHLLCVATHPAKLPETFTVSDVDKFLDGKVQEKGFVGLSVAVVQDGQMVLNKGYGQAVSESGQEVTPNTIFAIGSMTKQFISAGIFLCAEQGKLTTQDPVAKFYPKLTQAADLTLLDLMRHVSGYPDYYPLDFLDERMKKEIVPEELIRLYASGKLDFAPRTRFSYSNTGYIILGRIIEKVSGQKLGDFLHERIFKPLGMSNTLFDPDKNDKRLAHGHTTFALSDPEPVAPEARGWVWAAGGIWSTPADLAKWNSALINGKVLSAPRYAQMTETALLGDGRLTDAACGLFVETLSGLKILEHGGAVSGFNSVNYVVPHTHSSLTIFANSEVSISALGRELIALMVKVPEAVPEIQGADAAETAKQLLAQYQSGKVDRARFTTDFNQFLTDEKLLGASRRLAPFGSPKTAEILKRRERGGMEVTVTRFQFAAGELRALMYRQPDGKVAEFSIGPE